MDWLPLPAITPAIFSADGGLKNKLWTMPAPKDSVAEKTPYHINETLVSDESRTTPANPVSAPRNAPQPFARFTSMPSRNTPTSVPPKNPINFVEATRIVPSRLT